MAKPTLLHDHSELIKDLNYRRIYPKSEPARINHGFAAHFLCLKIKPITHIDYMEKFNKPPTRLVESLGLPMKFYRAPSRNRITRIVENIMIKSKSIDLFFT